MARFAVVFLPPFFVVVVVSSAEVSVVDSVVVVVVVCVVVTVVSISTGFSSCLPNPICITPNPHNNDTIRISVVNVTPNVNNITFVISAFFIII